MESKENKIKQLNKLDGHNTVPSGFEWDAMKEGIFQKMESQEAIRKAALRRRQGRTLLWLSSMVILLSLAILPFTNLWEEELKPVSEVIESTPQLKTTPIPSSPSVNQATQNNIGSIPAKSARAKGQTNTESPEANLNISKALEGTKDSGQTGKSLANSTHQANDSEPKMAKLGPMIVDSSFTPALAVQDSSISEDFSEAENLGRKSLKKMQAKRQFILEGGWVYWTQAGSTNAQFESPLSSFQLQGLYQQQLNQDYFWMAGIQYQQLESVFRIEQSIDNYRVIIPDTIVQVQNDVISGQQRLIYGDAEAYAEAERRVIHYNSSRLLKATLGFGRSFYFRSLRGDVYVGGALTTLSHNRGRALFNNQILDYEGSTNEIIENQFALEALVGLRLYQPVSKNLSLLYGLQWQKNLINWSASGSTNYYPSSFALQLGIGYRLP